MAQFCAGLKLEPYLCRDIIDKAGISLASPNREEFAYITVIDTMSGAGIEKINEYLESVGVKPFNIA